MSNLSFLATLDITQFEANIKKATSLARQLNTDVSTSLRILDKTANRRTGTSPRTQERIEQEKIKQAVIQTEQAELRRNILQKQLVMGAHQANAAFSVQQRLVSNLKTLFASYISIFAVKNFVTSIARMRGEYEATQKSLRALIGDIGQADLAYAKFKGLALKSPFTFKELTTGAKQLAAYNIAGNEVFDTMKRIGDLAAGTGVEMSRLILAYGQVRSAEFLRGQEVRQFSEAGINLVGELAKKFSELEGRSISAGEVFERISKRMVTFADVKDVLENLTNEGGKFFDLQRKRAETLQGKLSNLRDSYNNMLNDMGRTNQGTLNKMVDALRWLTRNWELVAGAIKLAAVAWIYYTIANSRGLAAIALTIKRYGVLGSMAHFVETGIKRLTIALKGLSTTNIVVGILTAAATAFALFYKGAKSTTEIVDSLNEKLAEIDAPIKEINTLINSYETLANKTNRTTDETEQLISVANQLSTTYLGTKDAITDVNGALDLNIEKIKDQRRELIESNKTVLELDLKNARQRLSKIEKQITRKEKFELANQMIVRSGVNTETAENELRKLNDLRNEREALRAAIANSEKILSELNIKLSGEDMRAPWQKAFNTMLGTLKIDEATKNFFTIQEDEYKKSSAELRKEIQEEVERLQKELDNAERDLSLDKYADAATKQILQLAKDSAQRRLEYAKIVADAYRVPLDSDKDEGEKKKSPIVEALEKDLEAMKKIAAERKKLEKTTGDATTYDSLFSKQISSFSQLKGVKVTSSYKEALEKAKSILEPLGNVAGKDELMLKISLALAEDSVNATKEKIKAAIEGFERYTSGFNLYKDLVSEGLDPTQALARAFGGSKNKLNIKETILKYINDVLNAVNKGAITDIDLTLTSDPIEEQLSSVWQSLPDYIKDALQYVEKFRSSSVEAATKLNTAIDNLSKNDWNLEGEDWQLEISKIVRDYNTAIGKIRNTEAEMLADLASQQAAYTDEEYKNKKNAIEENYRKEREYQKKLAQDKLNDLANSQLNQMFSARGLSPEVMQDWGDKTVSQISSIISELEELSDDFTVDNKIKQAVNEAGLSLDAFTNAIKKLLKIKIEQASTEKIKKIAKNLQDAWGVVISALDTVASSLKEIGGQSGESAAFAIDAITTLAKGVDIEKLSMIGKTTKDAEGNDVPMLSGLEQAGVYAQMATAVIKMVTGVISANKEANEAAARAAFEYAEALQEVNIAARLVQYDTIFGENELAVLKERLAIAKQLKKEAEDALAYYSDIDAYMKANNMVRKGDSLFGEIDYKAIVKNAKGAEVVDVISDMRSEWQKFWGSSKNQVSLWVSDIYDEFGNIDVEKLSAWFDTYAEGLSAKDKEMVEGLINDLEGYEEAMEAVADYIQSIFGQLASDIADKMIESFEQTGDAVTDLSAVFKDLGRDIVKSLLQSLILETVLTKYQDEVKDLYEDLSNGTISDEEFATQVGEILGRVATDVEGLEGATNTLLQKSKDAGLIGDSEDVSSFGGTIKGITENTAELLGSYLNAIRQSVAMESNYVAMLWNYVSMIHGALNSYYPTCTDYLMKIEGHNAEISRNTSAILSRINDIISTNGRSIRVEGLS